MLLYAAYLNYYPNIVWNSPVYQCFISGKQNRPPLALNAPLALYFNLHVHCVLAYRGRTCASGLIHALLFASELYILLLRLCIFKERYSTSFKLVLRVWKAMVDATALQVQLKLILTYFIVGYYDTNEAVHKKGLQPNLYLRASFLDKQQASFGRCPTSILFQSLACKTHASM